MGTLLPDAGFGELTMEHFASSWEVSGSETPPGTRREVSEDILRSPRGNSHTIFFQFSLRVVKTDILIPTCVILVAVFQGVPDTGDHRRCYLMGTISPILRHERSEAQ